MNLRVILGKILPCFHKSSITKLFSRILLEELFKKSNQLYIKIIKWNISKGLLIQVPIAARTIFPLAIFAKNTPIKV